MSGIQTEQKVQSSCLEKGWNLAVAESCTGGLLGGRITSVPGSSAYFVGGAITYSDDLKISMLGIKEKLVRDYGAVSSEVAVAMAEGVAGMTGADVGVAITGVAGPDGSEAKPPGTVHVAVKTPFTIEARLYHFKGTREDVRKNAVDAALELVLAVVTGDSL
ncbi:MAG: nicotinamide-nucleotide amidohydrolase family protein [bacterium]